VVRAKLDIALWSGLYVIYNPVVSFDLRCQSGIFTCLTAAAYIYFQKSMWWLFKFDHYSLFTNDVYTLMLKLIVGLLTCSDYLSCGV